MNNKLLIAALLFSYVVLKSNACGVNNYDKCTTRQQDTLLLNSSIISSKPVYHIGDTIWIGGTISDNFSPLSGAASFTLELNQLFLSVQPYSIKNNPSLPELQFANIEFNPFVEDGQLQNNGYGGYNFLYKRTSGLNTLKIGFIAGRTGLYIMHCNNDRYYYSNSNFYLYQPNDYCTTYTGISNFLPVQQNKNYWDSIGVAAVSLTPTYGSTTISKNMRNYFFFKVIP